MDSSSTPRPCCAVGARDDAAEIDEALRAAQAGTGTESLNAIHRRTGIRKERLIAHRDGCPGSAGSDHPGPAANRSAKQGEPSRGPSASPFAVPNPGDDPSTAPRKVVTALMEREAVRLRAKGLSYETIGEALGIDPETAQDAVERVLIRTRRGADEQADAARRLDLERVDQLLASLWDRATDPTMETVDVPADTETGVRAYDGQDKAVDRVTKLLERRAKLLGLDATTAQVPFYLAPGFDEFLGVLLSPLQENYPEALAAAMAAAKGHIAALAAAKPAKPGLRLVVGGRA